MKPDLTVELLCQEAAEFAKIESTYPEPSLYGVTDGKAVGTYFEHKFQSYLNVLHTTFVNKHRTGDFQTTSGLLKLLENGGNIDDIAGFLLERYLPVDEVQAYQLAEEVVDDPPPVGYLTISNALQWRLQYRRVVEVAGQVEGVLRIL